MRYKNRTAFLALVMAAGLASAAAATEINLGKHIEAVKVSGDLRLRQETFANDINTNAAGADRGRSRQRFRLRLGLEMPLNQALKAKVRFASGTGEQVSTNQSFDNLSSQNGIFIDLAMVEYKPLGFLRLTGGRMDLPLWKVYSSDILWDGDFSPMGFGASAEKLVGPVNVLANALYMVADEDGANAQGTDQSEISWQLGGEVRLPFESRVKAAFAQHQWINERTGTLTQTVAQNGNRRSAGGVLLNEYRVNEITGQLSFWILRIPAVVQATLITNADALSPAAMATPAGLTAAGHLSAKKDKGSQIGVILGKAGAAKSWEVAYFTKESEYDATMADVADSDFGNGGAGRKGSIMWVAYAPTDYTHLAVKHFNVKLEDGANFPLAAGVTRHDIQRTQLDFSVKF